ncbi:MAG: hypothetical protein AAFP83_12425 [Bacteroidota bacterium]
MSDFQLFQITSTILPNILLAKGAFGGMGAFMDGNYNMTSPVIGPQISGFRDVDFSFTVNNRNTDFTVNNVFSPGGIISNVVYPEDGGRKQFVVQVKTYSAKSKYVLKGILDGFDQIIPKGGSSSDVIPVLYVDYGAFMAAYSQSPDKINAKTRSLNAAGGIVVLQRGLDEKAR